jgi:hypothetical protein
MNKTQTQKFAFKVQGAISKQFAKLNAADHKEKMEFLAVISKEGQEYHPNSFHFI